jgi:hypothetical protein
MEKDIFVFFDGAATMDYLGRIDEIARVNVLPRLQATPQGKYLIMPYPERYVLI